MSTLLQERQQPITAPRLRDRVVAQRAAARASAGHQPATIVANFPIEAPRAPWRVILRAILATLRAWRRRSAARRELTNFNAWILRDIGVDPGIVNYELRQPFWRPLRDWQG